jgi:hypothetical protein
VCSGKAETPGGWTGIGRSVCDFQAGVNRSDPYSRSKYRFSRNGVTGVLSVWRAGTPATPPLLSQGVHLRAIVRYSRKCYARRRI